MICKNCGFEYVDGLKECPNCQTPNVPEEPKVLTEEERDTFGGVTIETTPDEQPNGRDYKVYDQQEQKQQEDAPSSYGFKIHTFSGISMLWSLIILIIVVFGLFIIGLPLIIFTLIAVVCYYLYIWLFS